jgi:hypothetical protein
LFARGTFALAIAAATFGYASPALARASAGPAKAADCTALTELKLPDTTITGATPVAAGEWAKTPLKGAASLPAFCRVVAHVRSAPDSDIGIEIWLPMKDWAGVFHGNGNGGFAGALTSGYPGMVAGLKRGFATAVTDTGTAPATPLVGDALIGHPRKWKDWGRLSTHVMTETGKAIAKAFYGKGPRRSYYTGCSTGGQQGLIEALYYPTDYDGIHVGAPVINRTWGHAAVLWDYAAAHRTPASLLSDDKLVLLNRAAIAKCGRLGGGIAGDPFIADPFACRFDPAELLCRPDNSKQCLTPPEVATARAFYSGPTAKDGKARFFGWLPGSEMPGTFGWNFLQTASGGQPQFGGLFKWVFGANWDWRQFDLDRDMPTVDGVLDADVNDATRGSLRAFAARGGKLILYHGLADSLVPPGQTVDFYRRQVDLLGGLSQARKTARLFLAPGVMHCGAGPGPDSFDSTLGIPPPPPVSSAKDDLFVSLIEWTERGRVPDRVVATKYASDETETIRTQRPLCAYPMSAKFKGSGSTDLASNFRCLPDPSLSRAGRPPR